VAKPLPLTVAVITLNEERNLARCLDSVRALAAEIVVLDCGSTDATADIARRFDAKFTVQPWAGHVAQKNAALQLCTQPWVLCLDADEMLTPELADGIHATLSTSEPAVDGFCVNRRTWYLGAWIWHAWYPEWRLRLARRERAEWRGIDPHDSLHVIGATSRLKGDLLHYSFRDLRDHLTKTIRYAHIMSTADDGRSFRWSEFIFSPPWALFRRLVLKQAWRDGWRGWLIAGVSAVSSFAKSAFRLERARATSPKPRA